MRLYTVRSHYERTAAEVSARHRASRTANKSKKIINYIYLHKNKRYAKMIQGVVPEALRSLKTDVYWKMAF